MDLTFLLSVARLQQEIHADSTKLDQSDDDDEQNVHKVWAQQLVDLCWCNLSKISIFHFIIHQCSSYLVIS